MMRVLCLVLVLVAFVACGASPPSSSDAGSTPTLVVIADGAATLGSQTVPTTNEAQSAPRHVDCGEIAMAGNPARALDSADVVRAAAACFAQAYESCTAAVLTIRERDTKIIRQFSVEPGAKCVVRQALQPDPNSPPALADCASVRAEKNGLVISACSHLGDFVLGWGN